MSIFSKEYLAENAPLLELFGIKKSRKLTFDDLKLGVTATRKGCDSLDYSVIFVVPTDDPGYRLALQSVESKKRFMIGYIVIKDKSEPRAKTVSKIKKVANDILEKDGLEILIDANDLVDLQIKKEQ